MVHIHQNTPPGDVVSRWAYSPLNKRFVELKLVFKKPVELEIRVRFDLRTQSGIADSIVQAKSVYLQPNESGDRVIDGMDEPKVLIEVPPQTKLPKWDSMLLTQITKRLKKDGVSKKAAKNAAKQHLETIREFFGKRLHS